jgi:hypothetical protein
LDEFDFPLLYRDVARAFEYAVPLLEKCMSPPTRLKTAPQSLKGKTLQVITKAANYVLKPVGI